jgi:hypothetical protein
MRIIAIHDSSGKISSVVTCEEGPHPTMALRPGLSMSEVQLPAPLAETDVSTAEGAAKLIEAYRVDAEQAKLSLVPR